MTMDLPNIVIPENLSLQTLILYIFYILVICVLPVVVKYGISVAKVWLDAKLAEMKDKYAAKKLNEAIDIVLQAVSSTTQTFVSTVRAKGEFTKEIAEEAFEKAKTLAMEMMSQEVVEYIHKTYNDFDTWLDSKIEQFVLEGKTVPVIEVVPVTDIPVTETPPVMELPPVIEVVIKKEEVSQTPQPEPE